MESFYQSWRTSAHNKIDCVDCHFEPGVSGTIRGKLNGLVQIVNYVSLSYKRRKPWAEIPDNTCARSGCHEKQALQDSTYNFKGVQFSHKNHLQEMKRGKTLKCTSCHSQIVQGTHIEVTVQTCILCHFKKSDDPSLNLAKQRDCKTCHKWENKTKEEMTSYRYDHSMVVRNKVDCNSCHTNTIAGNGEVEKQRCFQCHFENERLDKFTDTKLIHETHITKHSVRCFNCHNEIQHKIQVVDASAPPDCQSCHADAHSYQVNLFTGKGGYDVDNSPSPMFMNGINCKGCHVFHEVDKKDISTTKAGPGSCEKCHGEGYDNLLKQWQTASVNRLAVINSIYNVTERQLKNSKNDMVEEAEKILEEAKHNIRIVEVGKSVHNIQFADKLLVAAYGLMKQSLTVAGIPTNLPEFTSSSEFVPNECYNCHSGIQEISVKKYGMDFSHNLHIAKERIVCTKCHSNEQKHGELTLDKDACNSCHHSADKSNDACEKCHAFQSEVYEGKFLNKNQADYMKEGGVRCVDCHVSNDKVWKPDTKICLKCHDNSYQGTAEEWKKDINKLLKEAGDEVAGTKGMSLDNEQQALVSDTKKLIGQISAYPSIYVHNYDLLSTLLSEKIKLIRKIK